MQKISEDKQNPAGTLSVSSAADFKGELALALRDASSATIDVDRLTILFALLSRSLIDQLKTPSRHDWLEHLMKMLAARHMMAVVPRKLLKVLLDLLERTERQRDQMVVACPRAPIDRPARRRQDRMKHIVAQRRKGAIPAA